MDFYIFFGGCHEDSGYVYVFLSNEGGLEQQIGFDDYSVTHSQSAVIQQDDYYPFGLTFDSYHKQNSVDQNTPINTIEVDGNLFIFANGLTVSHYQYGKNGELPAARPFSFKSEPNSFRYDPDRRISQRRPL